MTPDPPSHAGDYAPGRRARETRAVGAPRASKRRMSPGRKLWYALLVALARGLLWLIWRSCRMRVHGGEHLDALRQAGSPAVIVYWHQMQIFCGWLLKRQSAQGMPIAVLTSPSVSGEVPAAMMRRWGVRPVRGSSTRSAARSPARDVQRGRHRPAIAGHHRRWAEGAAPRVQARVRFCSRA